MAETFNLKTFSVRFLASASVAVTCFYCITQIAWPSVCRMQVLFNERKENSNKQDLVLNNPKKVTQLSENSACKLQKLISCTYKHISRSHLKLLEYLEFYYGVTFSEREIYQIFAKNVPAAYRNITAFSAWLNFLEKSNFIQVQAGKICLTNVGLEFLQHTRQKRYFIAYSN